MNLEALQDNIVLRPIMAGNRSAGGIVLPNKGDFEEGAAVISIGPDVERLAVGDIVVRPDPVRYDISDDDTGEILLICAECDVLAKMLPDVTDVPEVDGPMEIDNLEAGVAYKCADCGHYGGFMFAQCKYDPPCDLGKGDKQAKPSEWTQRRTDDAPGEAKEAEESKGQGNKEQEVAADSEEGEVHPDGVPITRLDRLLPVHPVEGLHTDDGN